MNVDPVSQAPEILRDGAPKPLTRAFDPESAEVLAGLDFDVTTCSYEGISSDLFRLRELVFHKNAGLLAKDRLIDDNDRKGDHIAIRDKKSGELIAASMVIPAEESDFGEHTGLKPAQLESWFLGTRAMVHPDWRAKGLYKLIIYLVARHARSRGRKGYVCYIEDAKDKATRRIMAAEMLPYAKVRPVQDATGRGYDVHPAYCEADRCCARVFSGLRAEQQAFLADEVFGRDLKAVIDAGIHRFFSGKFCAKVMAATITRSEYIEAMANNHQFVRWTTRLLARIASETPDRGLRNHFLSHLKGEVDHDLWIENDLKELGADVAYVRDVMVPNAFIGQFMSVQESAAGFHSDPVRFLAVPIAIEAITAFMPKTFISGLHKAIASWGIASPAKASTFLTSHMYTDGGEGGHWVATFQELTRYIRSERQHQEALYTVRMVLDSVVRAYDSYVGEAPIDADPESLSI